jgi:AcrR family transcriptional regulator
MSTDKQNAGKPKTVAAHRARDRTATEEKILGAVEKVLARDGFASLGVNEIARQAGVDKVLIYRYFGGLPELLRAFGKRGNFWPSIEELLPDTETLRDKPAKELLTAFLLRFIDALRKRPLTIEILAMEIDAPNALSQVLDEVREEWGLQVARALGGEDHRNALELNINISLVIAGVQHLLVRARRTAMWSGIPIQDDRGWEVIKHGITWMVPRLLANGEVKDGD